MNYTFKDNTYSVNAKDNPKDRIIVEVGDSKQPQIFYPQVKLMRWDNECNFSARLVDDEKTQPVISSVGDKIEWTNQKKEIKFYELAPKEGLEEGGYEFEITLKEKPATNVITFTLQTKGLEFFYQPELTQEEKDRGASRPENVVGSYAVYYKNCPANYVGGKEYKCGKAFHIYRPRIEDAEGNWVWGELNIDEVNGLMTVTIPQTFLDEAVYPVRHAAGATFGYTTMGASALSGYYGLYGSLFTSPEAGDISGMSSVLQYATTETHAIYLHSDSSLLKSGATASSSGAKEWINSTFASAYTMSASTEYVLATFSGGHPGGKPTFFGDAGATNQGHIQSAFSLPNPASFTQNTNKYSIYATYTAGGGGGTVIVPTRMLMGVGS